MAFEFAPQAHKHAFDRVQRLRVFVAKIILALGSLGSISTETFRAFTEDEYRKIIGGLP